MPRREGRGQRRKGRGRWGMRTEGRGWAEGEGKGGAVRKEWGEDGRG